MLWTVSTVHMCASLAHRSSRRSVDRVRSANGQEQYLGELAVRPAFPGAAWTRRIPCRQAARMPGASGLVGPAKRRQKAPERRRRSRAAPPLRGARIRLFPRAAEQRRGAGRAPRVPADPSLRGLGGRAAGRPRTRGQGNHCAAGNEAGRPGGIPPGNAGISVAGVLPQARAQPEPSRRAGCPLR